MDDMTKFSADDILQKIEVKYNGLIDYFSGIVHFEDDKYLIDASGFKINVGTLSLVVLSEEFELLFNKAKEIVDELERIKIKVDEELVEYNEDHQLYCLTEFDCLIIRETAGLKEKIVDLYSVAGRLELGDVIERLIILKLAEILTCGSPSLDLESRLIMLKRSFAETARRWIEEHFELAQRTLLSLMRLQDCFKEFFMVFLEKSQNNSSTHNIDLVYDHLTFGGAYTEFEKLHGERESELFILWKGFTAYCSNLVIHFGADSSTNNRKILTEIYADSFAQLVYLDFIKVIEYNIKFKKCDHCHKYFIPDKSDQKYCKRLDWNNMKRCNQVGSIEAYQKSLKEKPYLYERQKFYQSISASLLRPYKGNDDMIKKQKLIIKEIMGYVNEQVGLIERTPDKDREPIIAGLMTWMDQKRSELMPRKKAK